VAVPTTDRRTLLSIATYAFDEEENLPVLYERLVKILGALDVDWELIVVDDHSSDGTFQVLRGIAERDSRVRGFRLSRNFGSHMAKICGLHHARGDCAVVIAADLQEPPELIPALLARWKDGAHVVSALRRERLGETFITIWFSRLYHSTMRGLLGLREMPRTDNSYCLLDRRVLECLRQIGESNISVAALVNWMGFRHEHVSYDQQPRLYGRSGWTLDKKIKLFIDTATMFSFRPIRWILGAGGALAAAGLACAAGIGGWALWGRAVQGWSVALAAILIVGGLQMLTLGVLGEYLWRALAEARRRPQYLIEESLGAVSGSGCASEGTVRGADSMG
jgi:glycosyltransferase involved in cell wall biosynthesis